MAVPLLASIGEPWPPEDLEHTSSCPVCGNSERETLYTGLQDRIFSAARGSWTLVSCGSCGCAYLDPRPTRESIGRAYAHYYTHGRVKVESQGAPLFGRLKAALTNGYLNSHYGYALTPSWRGGSIILPFFPRQRHRSDRSIRHLPLRREWPHLLDVGCGNGSFLRRMQDMGWQVHGLEPDEEAASAARAATVSVTTGGLEQGGFPDESFDAITLNHVLEHLHDPIGALGTCFRLLKPGGILWFATPNLASIGHNRFGRNWRGLEPPRHLVIFRPDSLLRELGALGFTLLARPPAYTAKSIFRASAALRERRDPYLVAPIPIRLQLEARIADLQALLQTNLAEEITVVAAKPERG